MRFYKHPENDPLAVLAPRNVNIQKAGIARRWTKLRCGFQVAGGCLVYYSICTGLFVMVSLSFMIWGFMFFFRFVIIIIIIIFYFVMVSLAFVLWRFMWYFHFGFYRPREESLVPQRPSPIYGGGA